MVSNPTEELIKLAKQNARLGACTPGEAGITYALCAVAVAIEEAGTSTYTAQTDIADALRTVATDLSALEVRVTSS